jgi:CheY-like chemotaxis protein
MPNVAPLQSSNQKFAMNKAVLQRILFVDDEVAIQEVARLALEDVGGFTVEVCSSGQEAHAKGIVFAPDLILMDVMMPGMDGPATLNALRGTTAMSATPVIFMTARTQADERAEYKALGALDVIPKPFDPMTLADQVNVIWCNRP